MSQLPNQPTRVTQTLTTMRISTLIPVLTENLQEALANHDLKQALRESESLLRNVDAVQSRHINSWLDAADANKDAYNIVVEQIRLLAHGLNDGSDLDSNQKKLVLNLLTILLNIFARMIFTYKHVIQLANIPIQNNNAKTSHRFLQAAAVSILIEQNIQPKSAWQEIIDQQLSQPSKQSIIAQLAAADDPASKVSVHETAKLLIFKYNYCLLGLLRFLIETYTSDGQQNFAMTQILRISTLKILRTVIEDEDFVLKDIRELLTLILEKCEMLFSTDYAKVKSIVIALLNNNLQTNQKRSKALNTLTQIINTDTLINVSLKGAKRELPDALGNLIRSEG